MLRFFRQIRQRLFAENRFRKFLLFGIVEIFIVIIGILIAIEVDNLNQERSQKKRYQFGIEKVYNRILADYFYWETYKDRAEYQIIVIDSLLRVPDAIPPNRILGNLLILDELIRDWYVDEEYYLDYFKFYPTDSVQFEILEGLRSYFYGSWEGVRRMYVTREEESFEKLLRRENIPICDLNQLDSFRGFIQDCSNSHVSSEYLSDLKELILTKKVRSKLHLLRARCTEMLATEFMPGSDALVTLETSFDFLDRDIKTMQITGSGTLNGFWEKGVEMNTVSNQPLAWESNITLKVGEIRFVTKDGNGYSWGLGELNQNKLTFGGPNIPVKAGTYLVSIDLDKQSYELIPVQ